MFLNTLKSKIAAAGLTDRILFPGEIAPDTLPALIQSLSAIVQLPRYEGYGMAPLEGMASAVPFIATDQGYYNSFSGQGTAGLIVPHGTPQETAAALHTLLFNPEQHSKMATAALNAARVHYSIQAEADGIAQVYEQLWQSK